MRASQEQSEATTLFLDSQARAAAQSLADQEAKVHAFEAQHEGALPQELQSNIQILHGIQEQLQSAMAARERALQQQTYLNSLLNQYQSMGTEGLAGAPATIDAQLETARAELAQLRAKYTDDHPDIKTMKDDIARLEKLKKDMGAEAKENLETNSATPAQVAAMSPIMQVQSELKANKQEIQALDAKIQQLQAAAAAIPAADVGDSRGGSADGRHDARLRVFEKRLRGFDGKKAAIGAGHQPAEAAAGRAVSHYRSSQSYRTSLPSPTVSSSRWQEWR